MQNLEPLIQLDRNRAIHIDKADMVHVQWQYITIRLNVTGLLCLINYLEQPCTSCDVSRYFSLEGTPDDGFVLWIQSAGLRLSHAELRQFMDLLQEAVVKIRMLGKVANAAHLPSAFKLTCEAPTVESYSKN